MKKQDYTDWIMEIRRSAYNVEGRYLERKEIEAIRQSAGSIEKAALAQPCYAPKGAG